MSDPVTLRPAPAQPHKLPLPGLLALSSAAFLTAMLEAMPAGILPAMSQELGSSEAAVGQTITVYAIGSLLGAIPIVTATRSWARRRLLATALVAFAVTTAVVALSPWLALTLVARFVTGVFAGVIWAVTALMAARITPEPLRGRGITIALAGPSVALAAGTPLGVLLAGSLGWRASFAVLAVVSIVVLVWVMLVLPALPAQAQQSGVGVLGALRRPGVVPIITASVLFITGQYVIYTYIATVLSDLQSAVSVGAALLAFGIAAVVSLWLVGLLIDRHMRSIVLVGLVLFAVAMLALVFVSQSAALVYVGIVVWGLAFSTNNGPAPQKALTDAAGDAADSAQAAIVTGWNIGIAAGGIIGGAVLGGLGSGALPWVTLAFAAGAFAIVFSSRRHGYPSRAHTATATASS